MSVTTLLDLNRRRHHVGNEILLYRGMIPMQEKSVHADRGEVRRAVIKHRGHSCLCALFLSQTFNSNIYRGRLVRQVINHACYVGTGKLLLLYAWVGIGKWVKLIALANNLAYASFFCKKLAMHALDTAAVQRQVALDRQWTLHQQVLVATVKTHSDSWRMATDGKQQRIDCTMFCLMIRPDSCGALLTWNFISPHKAHFSIWKLLPNTYFLCEICWWFHYLN